MSIDQLYYQSCMNESDIHEHLPTLYNHGLECNSIVEFGVRDTANSTRAFVKSLVDNSRNGTKNLSYIGVDIVPCRVDYIQQICKQNKIDYMFIVGDSIKVTIPETDLLFIDSWHVYGHLKRELAVHHSKVKKYIIMHDTTVDEEEGESIRCKWDTAEQSKQSGYPEEEIRKGLWPAIEEFLQDHPEWMLKERFTNNNGLTVLQRKYGITEISRRPLEIHEIEEILQRPLQKHEIEEILRSR